MSIINARTALLTHLESIADPWPTAWENISFDPPVEAPWQKADFIMEGPKQMGAGAESVEEWKGILQVMLCVPRGTSAKDALVRAEALRDHFRRSQELTDGQFTLTILNTEIHTGFTGDQFYHMPVSIYWQGYTFSVLPS